MKKIIIITASLVAVFCLYLSWNYLSNIYSGFLTNLPKVEKGITDLIKEKTGSISIPPPLRVDKGSVNSYLTKEGVIDWTNKQRAKEGLASLKENFTLDVTAEKKAEDMLQNQYFAHESPNGAGVSDLANNSGYEFIAIGENLAMGNFENDEVLVQAWMDSPGHRANILNNRYQEIGVSVIKGTFEGKTTWMAVQHFGLPLSACPKIDESLKTEINQAQNQIKIIENSLNILKNEIEIMKPKRGAFYMQKIEEYNNFVSQHNIFVEDLKLLINKYNNQVKAFNNCVGSSE
jgi:uncharacterized protein YkwD